MADIFSVIAQIAEQKIVEAEKAGDFANLPGAGKPLELEDLSHIPEDMRMAYRVLKNSGYLPPEVSDRKEAGSLCDLLDNCSDERERLKMMIKLRGLLFRMRQSQRRSVALEEHDDYYQKILARLEAHERQTQISTRTVTGSKKA